MDQTCDTFVFPACRHGLSAGTCKVCALEDAIDNANARITALVELLQDTFLGHKGQTSLNTKPFNLEEARARLAALVKP